MSPPFSIVSDVVRYRAPKAKLMMLPKTDTGDFIRNCIKTFAPTHLISLERPGKAANGHYHSMRGEVLDDMITDSALFLSEAKNPEPPPSPSATAATRWAWAPTAT